MTHDKDEEERLKQHVRNGGALLVGPVAPDAAVQRAEPHISEAQCSHPTLKDYGGFVGCAECGESVMAEEKRTGDASNGCAHDWRTIESDDQAGQELVKCRECGVEQLHKLRSEAAPRESKVFCAQCAPAADLLHAALRTAEARRDDEWPAP